MKICSLPDLICLDSCTPEQEEKGELKTVFEDGEFVKTTTLEEIRKKLWG